MIYLTNGTQVENQEGLDQLGKSRYSHDLIKIGCDLKVSIKCRNIYEIEFRHAINYMEKNGGKISCIFCSRTSKFSGRNNPNTKYTNLDDNFFQKIDSNEKAYLLGWIASDGSLTKRGFSIAIHQKDIAILYKLRDIICKEVPLSFYQGKSSPMCKITVNSQNISLDVCKLLKITYGKKSAIINFPNIDEQYVSHFLRGYFEGDGTINNRLTAKRCSPRVSIASNSKFMLKGIKDNIIIPCLIYKSDLYFNTRESILFCDYIYSNISDGLFLQRKYDRYINWKNNYVFNEHLDNKGENSHKAKLTWNQITDIRLKFSQGETLAKLGRDYNVSPVNISHIIKNKTWKKL